MSSSYRMTSEPWRTILLRTTLPTSAACFCPHFSPRSRLHAWLHLEMCVLHYLLTSSLKRHELYWLVRADVDWNKRIESKWKLQQLSRRLEQGSTSDIKLTLSIAASAKETFRGGQLAAMEECQTAKPFWRWLSNSYNHLKFEGSFYRRFN